MIAFLFADMVPAPGYGTEMIVKARRRDFFMRVSDCWGTILPLMTNSSDDLL
jgi:hypothetical protein